LLGTHFTCGTFGTFHVWHWHILAWLHLTHHVALNNAEQISVAVASSNASLTLEAFKSATDVTQIEQALIAALEQIQAGALTLVPDS